jgi:hypothetical protein
MQCIYLGVHSPLPLLDDALPLQEDLPLQEEDGTETVLEPLVAESPLSVLGSDYLGVHSPLPVLDDALPLPEDLPLQEEDGTETVLEPLVAESPLSVLERTSEPRGEERPSPRGVTAGRELTIDNGQQEIDDLEDKLDNVNSTIATVHHRISLLKKQVCELEPQRDRIRRKIRKLNK